MKAILATDGSSHSMKAAGQARWLAQLDPALAVTVLYVLPRPITFDQAMTAGVGLRYQNYEDEFARLAEQVLDRTVGALDLPPERITRRILIGVPGEVVCSLAREEKADLIIIGARGDSAIRELLLGSTTHRVVQLAPCPVLVVR